MKFNFSDFKITTCSVCQANLVNDSFGRILKRFICEQSGLHICLDINRSSNLVESAWFTLDNNIFYWWVLEDKLHIYKNGDYYNMPLFFSIDDFNHPEILLSKYNKFLLLE